MAVSVSEGSDQRFACQSCWQIERVVAGSIAGLAGVEHAAYQAGWGSGQPAILLAVAVGPWGLADELRRPVAVLRLELLGEVVRMRLVDARGHHFYPDQLGRPLSRLEALREPRRRQLWRAAEAAVHEDQRLGQALRRLVERRPLADWRDLVVGRLG